MNQIDKSWLRIGAIRSYLDSEYLDRMSNHPVLRGVRQRLEEYYNRVKTGGMLTDEEIKFIDFVSFQVVYFLKHGQLSGYWIKNNGVWGFELSDQRRDNQQ